MVLVIVGVGLSISVIRIFISKKSKNPKKPTIQVYNLSDRVIKNKKYQYIINESTKPTK